ncbi:DUF2931 family protein [Vibrio europaeus]|uniref:DUF2931 family protein n=1 Tax=Vibrio europaeus TaxID=300876 RepID=A0A178JEJ0_9VIBR|nr:DUF2931 family protein [Vibrio europaeus]MDC5707280.1 DUF2931 family protein [Vibrio europaeus]MDC5712645.1 DUF2931 family protein [Vibrio europaeus]MDC5717288.1 DUF2931 family protein [Vibrio europaeus]MDC5721178.1 DUF2931 family protein [Vibrio europaeus]MDC5726588.1 DUF2931 family protein [Vibrio europaeus]
MKQLMAILLLVVPVVSNAFAKVPSVPEDMPKWRIGYAMSSLYPAKITEAYGVNEEQDWTSFVHNDMHFMTRTELSKLKKKLPDYDGYSLVLGTPVTMKRQVAGTKTLPDSVFVYWASISNARFFVTKFDLTKEVKSLMVTKRQMTTWDGAVLDCYQNDIVFGFLPNGNTKVWLDGCGEYKYVTELMPDAELEADSRGNNAKIYKANYGARITKRAEEAGETLDPIPWDKVNKVFSSGEATELN